MIRHYGIQSVFLNVLLYKCNENSVKNPSTNCMGNTGKYKTPYRLT